MSDIPEPNDEVMYSVAGAHYSDIVERVTFDRRPVTGAVVEIEFQQAGRITIPREAFEDD